MMSVSAPSKHPSPVPAVKEEQIHNASPCLPPPRCLWAEGSWEPSAVKGAFLVHRGHFKWFYICSVLFATCWGFNALPLLRRHTWCLQSVQKGPINDWSLNLHSVLYCIVKCSVFSSISLSDIPDLPHVYIAPPPPLQIPTFSPSLILETND